MPKVRIVSRRNATVMVPDYVITSAINFNSKYDMYMFLTLETLWPTEGGNNSMHLC